MYGGSITNNSATIGDGACGVHNLFGTFTMYGGSITGNSADTRCGGGGVYLARMGEFVMKGGEITGNTAKNGGGVYTAVNGNTGLTVSGDAAITGNSNTAGKDENVYLVSGKTIEIGADGLGEKASIGVTTADTITTGSYVTVANGAENGYTDGNIFSDAGAPTAPCRRATTSTSTTVSPTGTPSAARSADIPAAPTLTQTGRHGTA